MTGNLAVTLRAVDKRFGATHAVRDLDLDLPEGSLCGFLGPNGAGKSTTIRMIMSIIYPDAGAVEVLGSSALKNKDRIGYLPEERGLYRKMRVGEFLEYLARLKGLGGGLGGRSNAALVKDWLERIDLPDVYKKRCQELSKGMQQKVQFLAAIIHEPDLVILDEPFSGLDPVNADLLNRLVRELNEAGRTVIFSTHVLHQAEQICDRIVLINHGRKLLDATQEEIHARFDPRTIEIEPLSGADPGALLVELSSVQGVEGIALLDGGPSLEVSLRDGADPQDVMGRLLAARPLRSIKLRRLTLEEVFVHHVRDDEGDAAAAKARQELSHV